MYEGGTKEWYHALQNRFFDPVLLHCVRTVEGDRGGEFYSGFLCWSAGVIIHVFV